MKKGLASYFILGLMIIILIGLNCYCYIGYKKVQNQNMKNITSSILEQTKLEKEENIKGSFGYSDILNFSSSNEGMKISNIEKSAGETQRTKVNFQYEGNNMSFEGILDKLQKQENLISVSNIKITHNKDSNSILVSVNATFIKNK